MDIILIPDGISGKITNQSINPGSIITDKNANIITDENVHHI